MVMAEAYDADMVLDLHCADDALNHIYIVPQLMPEYQDLS
jgi:predicted deacylase